MNKLMPAAILIVLFCLVSTAPARDVLIDRGFRDENTLFIVCKGYPKESLAAGAGREESAREAALINAQALAAAFVDLDVDVIKEGLIESFVMYDRYAVITYTVTSPGILHKRK